MSRLSYREIKKKVKELADKINAPAKLLPVYKWSNGDASPLIEIDKIGNFHYVKIERGKEWSRKTTNKLEELLFWVFADVTFWMSVKYELDNRIDHQDNRRIMFAYQKKLLGILNKSWQQLAQDEHLQILADHPFIDPNVYV